MRHRPVHLSVALATLTLLVASLSGCAEDEGPNTASDQAIADEAVLTEDDLPGWAASPPDDDDEPDEPDEDFEAPAECRALEEKFGDLDDLFDDGETDSPTATSPEFELETESSIRFLSNEVSVTPDAEEVNLFFDVVDSEGAVPCFEAIFAQEMASEDEAMTIEGLTVDDVDLGDRGVQMTMRASAEIEGMPFEMTLMILMVQVDRAGVMFMFGGLDILASDAGMPTITAPSSDALMDELEETGVLELVVERLEESLA